MLLEWEACEELVPVRPILLILRRRDALTRHVASVHTRNCRTQIRPTFISPSLL